MRRKDGTLLETLISTSDLEKVNQFPNRWSPQWSNKINSFYAFSTLNHKRIFLHRFILDFPQGKFVDHINHDTLNNTRTNLRIVSCAENLQNKKGAQVDSKSGIRGVSFCEKSKKWRADVTVKRKTFYLGLFKDLKEAERAVIEARKKYMPYSTT